MNKNPLQKISDEQLDRLIKTVLHSTIFTDEEIDEIADAPQLRRQILNCIADEKSRRENRWFFAWRWQAATAGAFLFLFVAGAAVWFSNSLPKETAAVSSEKINSALEDKFVSSEIKPQTAQPVSIESQTENSPAAQRNNLSVNAEKVSSKTALKLTLLRAEAAPRKIAKTNTARAPKTEVATEFIALSYLPASESGQVVRVKVPRSMLVSLGVSTNVERSKEMVNAEVVVGDDGAARAIRFLNE